MSNALRADSAMRRTLRSRNFKSIYSMYTVRIEYQVNFYVCYHKLNLIIVVAYFDMYKSYRRNQKYFLLKANIILLLHCTKSDSTVQSKVRLHCTKQSQTAL